MTHERRSRRPARGPPPAVARPCRLRLRPPFPRGFRPRLPVLRGPRAALRPTLPRPRLLAVGTPRRFFRSGPPRPASLLPPLPASRPAGHSTRPALAQTGADHLRRRGGTGPPEVALHDLPGRLFPPWTSS